MEKVLQSQVVLELAHAYHGGALRQFVGAELGEHAGHVVELGLILHFAPLVPAVGQILVVVLACIVQGVEKVFKVVEGHAVEGITLGLLVLPCGERRQRGERRKGQCEGEKNTSHEIHDKGLDAQISKKKTNYTAPLS